MRRKVQSGSRSVVRCRHPQHLHRPDAHSSPHPNLLQVHLSISKSVPSPKNPPNPTKLTIGQKTPTWFPLWHWSRYHHRDCCAHSTDTRCANIRGNSYNMDDGRVSCGDLRRKFSNALLVSKTVQEEEEESGSQRAPKSTWVERLSLDDFGLTIKPRTVEGDREAIGDTSNDTGQTLVE